MGILFCILLLVCGSFLLGISFRKNRDSGIAFRFLTGIMVWFCVLQVLSLAMRFFSLNFTYACYILLALLGLVAVVMLAAFRDVLFYVPKDRHEFGAGTIIFLSLLVIQILCVLFAEPYTEYDMTAETVTTIVYENSIQTVNALTGEPLAGGLYFVPSFNILPVFYAMLVKLTGVSARTLLYSIMLVFVLLLSYTLHGVLSRALFTEDAARDAYLVLVCLLNLFGTFSDRLLPFYLLRSGWQGDTILFLIILPFELYLAITPDRRSAGSGIFYLLLATLAGVSVAGITLGAGLSAIFWLVFVFLLIRRWRHE